MHGIELLGVVRGRLEQAGGAGLNDAAAEAVGQVAAVGDLDHVTMAVHEVVIAAARQGVIERPERGTTQPPIAGGRVPFGDAQTDVPSRGVFGDLPAAAPTFVHAHEVAAAVVVRADVVDPGARLAESSPGDGVRGRRT